MSGSSLWLPSRRAVLAGALALPAAPAFADPPATARTARVSVSGARVRVDLALDRAARADTFFLAGPDRFVVDLANCRWESGAGETPGAGFVRRARYAPRPDGSARLVLDLDAPAALALEERAGRRATPGIAFELTAHGAAGLTDTGVVAADAAPVPLRRGRRPVVVIDPGHGGHDPGAVGVTGVREKDVVLDAALQVREALASEGRYDVRLTRDADVFVPLPDRVRIARAAGADLFVSLHADANSNTEARGASIYTLSERGGDRARNLMDQQNWNIDLGDAPRSNLVNDILVGLAQRETSDRSAAFAQTVIGDLRNSSAPLLANTHRNAGYFVLLAPDVPAVLLEMGFLTNGMDERRLADPRERGRIAGSLKQSVDHYFAARPSYMARA